MKMEKVVKWLKTGYPHFKKESGLPTWVLPEHSFTRAVDELGDSHILEVSRPLRFAEGLEVLLEKASDPETLPVETWQMAVMQWPPLVLVKPMVEACLEATALIMRQFCSGQPKAEPIMVCRGMAVLGFAPFLPQGEPVMREFACILQGDRSRPAELVKQYAAAVVSGDMLTLSRVDDCIVKHSQWMEWARIFLDAAQSLSYSPKMIAVTPPLSAELAGVLADMIKETREDDSGRHYPQCSAS